MRYTKYNNDMERWEVPCYWKEDGERLIFLIREEPGDIIKGGCDGPIQLPGMTYVSGEAIDRLADLETKQEAAPFELRRAEFFIQGYLEHNTFYHCPRCGLNFGDRNGLKKRGL